MSIKITGNQDIDEATAEIAVALRDANPGQRQQEYYDMAESLRDAIMAGTRQLALDKAVTESEWMAGDRERVLDEADAAVTDFENRFTWGRF
jgi:hypothetical protein